MKSVTELELAAVRWLNANYFDSLESVRWKDLFAAISRDGLEVTDESGLIAHLVARGLVIKEIPVRPEHFPVLAWKALGMYRSYKYRASPAVLDAAASGAGATQTAWLGPFTVKCLAEMAGESEKTTRNKLNDGRYRKAEFSEKSKIYIAADGLPPKLVAKAEASGKRTGSNR